MKKLLLMLLVLLIALLLKVFPIKSGIFNHKQATQIEKKQISLGETKILVEVADTSDKREKGLSGRNFLPENEGLLFIFDEMDVRVPFWMKEMKFPIDIIWINDGVVSEIQENLPPPNPNTTQKKLKLYLPQGFFDQVLEVNAGFVAKNKIKVGESVDLSSVLK